MQTPIYANYSQPHEYNLNCLHRSRFMGLIDDNNITYQFMSVIFKPKP